MTEKERAGIEKEISHLPAGGITIKTIHGKKYPYLQWTENGKQKGRRVKDEELDYLRESITRRKELQARLKEESTADYPAPMQLNSFFRVGNDLRAFIRPAMKLRKRDSFSILQNYLQGDISDRVFILYGLRRTGKTTLIRQAIAEMTEQEFSETAFIQVSAEDNLASLNQDLRQLERRGFRYVFLDEVTLMEDFIEGAALFSDVFAASGMKIVLSGTDSLGFVFSEDEQLYDRCIMLHTTMIPYREFERVLGIQGIDEYIRYGGTMSMGGAQYNVGPTFATRRSTDEYVDSAIARNIQHSLRYYQYGGHFRNLYTLYEKNELTSAINRIIEDINHEFTLEVLTRKFRSHDLRVSAANLRRDRVSPSDILDRVDQKVISDGLRQLLEIRNKEEQTIEITEAHRREIKEYLDLLDLTYDIPIVHMADFNLQDSLTVITQPGLRYSQAESLISQLVLDDAFRTYDLAERNRAMSRILSEVRGRMMEDIILLETQTARKNVQVCKVQFAVGEFDMLVFDPAAASCQIYEIKHSAVAVPEQARHLKDPKKCEETEHRFGPIRGKYVIYRGESVNLDGVEYINVEEYLLGLGKTIV